MPESEVSAAPLHLLDLDLAGLEEQIAGLGLPRYRARQVWEAVFRIQQDSFTAMTTLPLSLRTELGKRFVLNSLVLVRELTARDGLTTKVLFKTRSGDPLETVLMRYERRNTLCISTQSGCAMGCSFCATGQMGFHRSLTPGEIVEQVLFYSRRLTAEGQKVTNVVFMGMGEPFHNYEGTLQAAATLGDRLGFAFGARRMTISTVGIVPQILRFADANSQINLAVSLHAVDNALRSRLMPINKRYPVEQLLEACRTYVLKTNRRITFEWALIQGINDSAAMAKELASRIGSLLCHVNLIQLNPTSRYSGQGSDQASAQGFLDVLQSAGIPGTLRLRRGIDIHAGCGQLAEHMSEEAHA